MLKDASYSKDSILKKFGEILYVSRLKISSVLCSLSHLWFQHILGTQFHACWGLTFSPSPLWLGAMVSPPLRQVPCPV